MKIFLLLLAGCTVLLHGLIASQPAFDPTRIEIHVTPFYDSKGPSISVGRFSKGLASTSEREFLATIKEMKGSWTTLTFAELYVAAIRLYDMEYRREAVYWYYTAQYRGRLFGLLLDEKKMGGIGASGFEMLQAQGAFFQLVGPYITGYAFTDFEHLVGVIEKVKKEGEKSPDWKATYRGVKFKDEKDWVPKNNELNAGMSKLLGTLNEQKDTIRKRRIADGSEAKFSQLKSKELPGR